MKQVLVFLLFFVVLAPAAAQKKGATELTKEQATKVVREQYKNAVILESELETEHGVKVWSFDLKTDKTITEVWVDAHTGKIVKTEKESAAAEKNEKAVEAAEKAALKEVPGTVVATGQETKKGVIMYTFEITKADGTSYEVEVNGKTNKVTEVEKMGDGDKDEDDEDEG
jgi:uncharacterized membrane protein YkoI